MSAQLRTYVLGFITLVVVALVLIGTSTTSPVLASIYADQLTESATPTFDITPTDITTPIVTATSSTPVATSTTSPTALPTIEPTSSATITVTAVTPTKTLTPTVTKTPTITPTASATPVYPPTTYVVNSIADTNDGSCDSANCTLREALHAANADSNKDTIAFKIPGKEPHTITYVADQPVVQYPVTIDATTQPGYLGTPVVGLYCTYYCLDITSSMVTVRGLAFLSYNLAVALEPSAGNSVIEGNFFGTDFPGKTAVNFILGRTAIAMASPNNRIGGTTPGSRNLISGNAYGVLVSGQTAYGNHVEGNLIGTDVTGTNTDPTLINAYGIEISSSSNNVVGGTTPEARNIITGNFYGVEISLPTSTSNIIQGNYIGLDIHGLHTLGSDFANYRGIDNHGYNTLIGGTTPGAGNVITGQDYGILLSADTGSLFPTGGFITGNSIFGNGRGIDLSGGVPLPNDPLDIDFGPNTWQNYPVLTSAVSDNQLTTILGRLNSAPNTTFRIEFFGNNVCDAGGYGEGETYLGFGIVTTDSAGNVDFNITVVTGVKNKAFVTATATNPGNNTSEFSACITSVIGKP